MSWRRRPRSWRAPQNDRRDAPLLVKGTRTAFGYTAYILRDLDGKPIRKLAHRLVALAFLPNPHGLSDVAHNDGDPTNNAVANLRWASHRDNQMDMRRHGTMQDGSKCITAKIDEATANLIRTRIANGPRGTARAIAAELGLSPGHVSRIAAGKRWAAIAQKKDHDSSALLIKNLITD